MNKTLNTRYLFRFLAILAVVLVAIWFVHRLQAGKQTDAFLHQADVAEQEYKPGRAIGYLRRYLVMKPNDTDARAHLAFLLADNARTKDELSQAFLEMEEVLRQDSSRDDIRRGEIDVMMRLGMLREAKTRLEELIGKNKTDGTLHDLKGQCLSANNEYAAAESAFTEAIKHKPDLILAHGRLAFLQKQRLARTKDADETIKEMVVKNPKSAAAHLMAASYWKDAGRQKEYETEVETAQSCDAEDPEVVLAVAGLRESQADAISQLTFVSSLLVDNACTLLRHSIDKRLAEAIAPFQPSDRADRERVQRLRGLVATMFVTLARFEMHLGRVAEAEKTTRQAVEAFPKLEAFAKFGEPRLKLADVCILQKNWDEAGRQLDELEQNGYPAGVVKYNRGRILMGQEQWCEASRFLEQAAKDTLASAPLMKQIQFLLGTCYDRTGLLDRRLEAYQRARPAPGDERWLLISMRIGGTLVEMGRMAEAKSIYGEVATRYTNANIPLARLLLAEVSRKKNPTPQDFAPIEKLTDSAPKGVEKDLFAADLALAMKKPSSDVRKAIEKAKIENEKAIEPWAALAFFEWRQNDVKLAESILDQAAAKFGDRALFRLIRARIRSQGKAVAEELMKSAAGLDSLDKDERRRLLRGLAEIAQAADLRETADRFWDQLAVEWPDNLGVQLVRFDNAMRTNNTDLMEQAKSEIIRLDSDIGASTRFAQALQIIWKARQQKDNSDLARAEETLSDLARQRQGWGRIPLAQAVILDLRRQSDLALKKYRDAFDLGEGDPELLRRLVELYTEYGQFAEAKKVMRQLPEGVEQGERFQQVVAELSMQSGDYTKALELAEKAVREDSRDYGRLIRLNRARWLAGKADDALTPLERAIKLAPQKPEAWVALVQYYTLRKQENEARKAIKDMTEVISHADKKLTLAECYEIIGGRDDIEKAVQYYGEALEERPDDVRVLKNAAGLRLWRNELDEAQSLFERILKSAKRSEEDERIAKRQLTFILALNPDYEKRRQWLEKEGRLDPKPLTGLETLDEIRTRAFALALQPDVQSRREAIRLLRELDFRVRLRSEEQFLLARLHASIGDWKSARPVMAELLQSDAEHPNPLHVAFYVDGLTREQALKEAESWLVMLEGMNPVPPRTVEMRARWYGANRQVEKAAELLTSEARKPGAEIARIAKLMEEIGIGAAAEALHRKLMDSSKQLEARLELAVYYGRQGRLADALALCDETWRVPGVNHETVCSGYVRVLYAVSKPPQEKISQVALRVEEELHRRPLSVTMLSNMAAVRNLQGERDPGKYAEAIGFYRAVLKQNAKDTIALNNLGYLLSAAEKKHGEALAELEKAIRSVGRLSTLLDTQAQVYIAKGEAESAIKLLNEAIVLESSGSHYFHLAQAYMLEQRWKDAKIAWNQAQELKLKESDLHPLERDEYNKLAGKMQSL